MKGRLFYCIVITLCSLIITGAGLSVYFVTNTDRRDVVRVELNDEETERITFNAEGLLPGREVGYDISLHTNLSGTSSVSIGFEEETQTAGGLRDFVWVRLVNEGRTLYEATLTDALTSGSVTLEEDLASGETITLGVLYYMPREIGNEAQGLDAEFTLSVCASNEGESANEQG
ncbi:MAG: hypothetical protein E7609_01410 [Ruminococcaceae bacterium]|nr:hypothetical protein [Oscillospiraceae bacterium]